jgi:predicted  nucleic acid-binding Zn-ribbon protein
MAALMIGAAGQLQTAQAATVQQPAVMVSLSQLNGEIHKLRETLGKTMSALDQLKDAAKTSSDLNGPYGNFSAQYNELEGQVSQVRQHGTALKARAKEHWEAWQKELTEMQNPKLREKAQKRYTATSAEFEKITKRVDTAKETFAPLAADLKDISTYLKADLSKDAVSSLSNTIWKMGISSRSADSKMADVNEQIEKTMQKMPQS